MDFENPFSQLADDVQRSRPGAARDYRREMKPKLEYWVRRALGAGAVDPWYRKILAEVERVLVRSGGFLTRDSDDLPGVVAERLCDRAIDDLQARGRGRHAAPACTRETVLC
jgi:hypothetical protein